MNTQTIRVLEEVVEYSKKNPEFEIKFQFQNIDSNNDFTFHSPVSWEIVDHYCTDDKVYTDEDSILEEINNSNCGETDDVHSLLEAVEAGYKIDTVLIVRMGF